MRVPAVCDNCSTVFASGFEATNSTNIGFSNCSAGPCPACGAMGHIPDGVYNFIGNTIELLSGPGRTVSELQRLATILKAARDKSASLEQVGNEIQANMPELASLKDILPRNRSELYPFLALILSVITLLLSQMSSQEPSRVEINSVINNIYQQAPAPQRKQASKDLTPRRKGKIGRNDPCFCGSGKKYKKCCLQKA